MIILWDVDNIVIWATVDIRNFSPQFRNIAHSEPIVELRT
jgi:hypothetical protein